MDREREDRRVHLIASLIVKDELGRYLKPCVESLLEFCDEVAMVDDGSTDGTHGWAFSQERVHCCKTGKAHFFEHEGRARQFLLEWTLAREPTHILAIDADEFIADGRALRAAIDMDEEQPVWTLEMDEVWKADERNLWLRRDGGWRPHAAPILYAVPAKRPANFRIQDKALACGREPMSIRAQFRHALKTGTEILHFGWTNVSERRARYDRYVEHDSGQFHQKRHLDSIMYDDRRVGLTRRSWPVALLDRKAALLERINRTEGIIT